MRLWTEKHDSCTDYYSYIWIDFRWPFLHYRRYHNKNADSSRLLKRALAKTEEWARMPKPVQMTRYEIALGKEPLFEPVPTEPLPLPVGIKWKYERLM